LAFTWIMLGMNAQIKKAANIFSNLAMFYSHEQLTHTYTCSSMKFEVINFVDLSLVLLVCLSLYKVQPAI
jgi:hypothetical protein